MKRSVLLILIALFVLPVSAEEALHLSRSAGKTSNPDTVELQKDQPSKTLAEVGPDSYKSRAAVDTSDQVQNRTANRHDQYFSIFDAKVDLIADFDRDGFHHALNVSFDVDVDHDTATVYTKLYLSKDGGPWIPYYTTDLFNIYGESYTDSYEVDTELVEGYLPGYYDVLIEVYSLNHAYMVASEVLDQYYLGRDVTLEDLTWDRPLDETEYYYEEEISYSYGGGGNSDFTLLIVLILFQVAIVARGILTLTPVKRK